MGKGKVNGSAGHLTALTVHTSMGGAQQVGVEVVDAVVDAGTRTTREGLAATSGAARRRRPALSSAFS